MVSSESDQPTTHLGTICCTPLVEHHSTPKCTPPLILTYTPRGGEEWMKKVDDGITPKINLIFTTLDAGIEFYKQYANACGFQVRKSSQKRFRDGTIRTKHLVCHREGFTRETKTSKNLIDLPNGAVENPTDVQNDTTSKKKAATKVTTIRRFGCDAMIKFVYQNGMYCVKEFYEAHSHKLVSENNKEFLKFSRNLSLYHKQTIIDHSKLNIGAAQSYRICKEYANGYENIGATLLDFKNFKRDMRCFIGLNDAQLFIDNFKSLSETSKGFFYAYDVAEGNYLSKLFWSDAISRRNYSVFGDAMSFDPTYGTNKYCMVFTPFTGVDNHKKSVTFAGALLAHEDEESFKWVFEKFLDAMGRKEPNYIITDQDPAIKLAVATVFKKARHRYCMWHIMTKVPDKVGTNVYKETDFLQRLNAAVWDGELEPVEFEMKWKQLMADFGLEDHKWLKGIFDIKEKWIPAYHRDLEMGNILRTTQRSESANSFYKKFENKYGTLVDFWMRFQTALDQQRYTNKTLEHENALNLPKTITRLCLESHGAEVYTMKVFTDFQEEVDSAVLACGVCGFQKLEDVEINTIRDATTEKRYEVEFNVTTKDAKCSCKLFEMKGILCRHIVCVYSGSQVKHIPDKYLVTRWMKNALKRPIYDLHGNIVEEHHNTDMKKIELSKLWSEIYATIGVIASKEIGDMKTLGAMLKDFREALDPTTGKPLSKEKEIEKLFGCTAPTEVTIHPPKKSSNKGSGSGSAQRLISAKAKAIQNANRPKRMCKKCKKLVHHDSRNCPNPEAEREEQDLQENSPDESNTSSMDAEDNLVPSPVVPIVRRQLTRSMARDSQVDA